MYRPSITWPIFLLAVYQQETAYELVLPLISLVVYSHSFFVHSLNTLHRSSVFLYLSIDILPSLLYTNSMRSLVLTSAAIPLPSLYTNSASVYHHPLELPKPTTPDTPGDNQPTRRTDASAYPHSFFSVTNDSSALSTHTKNYITQAIQSSLADTTVKRYSGTIKQFIRFCDAERVPEHLRFPTDEFVLLMH